MLCHGRQGEAKMMMMVMMMIMIDLYNGRPKKSCTLAFCKRPPFALITGRHLQWHCFDKLIQHHNIYFHPEVLSMGLKSGLCGGQFMCANYSSCSLTLIVSSCSTLSQLEDRRILALLSWNIP